MKIACIVIPGKAKQHFVHALHEQTQGVELVIIQKKKEKPALERIKRSFQQEELWGFLQSTYFGILLRLDRNKQKMLGYFRARTDTKAPAWPAKTLETTSVNSEKVYAALQELQPDLLVVWGSGIIEPRILQTSKKAINLHMGLAPYYRGAIANQQAMLQNDLGHIGATAHYITSKADAGCILDCVKARTELPLRDMFVDLNDRAEQMYLDVALKLSAGENVDCTKQDLSRGSNYLLKDWTPRIRYQLANHMQRYEKEQRQ